MNIENTKKCIEVMQAFVDGKEISQTAVPGRDSPYWNWHNDPDAYFIKPEPRVIYVNEYENGNTCAHPTEDRAVYQSCGAMREAVEYKEVIK